MTGIDSNEVKGRDLCKTRKAGSTAKAAIRMDVSAGGGGNSKGITKVRRIG